MNAKTTIPDEVPEAYAVLDAQPLRVDEHGHELLPLTDLQLAQLKADLNPARITQRKQGGSTLSYLEGYDVKATLTRIFGFGGYSAEVFDSKILKMEEREVAETRWDDDAKRKVPTGKTKLQWRAVAQASLRLHIHQLGATYAETAISSQDGIDPGEVADFAVKTAETDALKRCAINLGTQFGLSLYNKGATEDVIGLVIAPGQRQIDQDRMRLARRAEQMDIIAEMERLGQQLQEVVAAQQNSDADEANPATGEVPGGQRHAEEAPPSVADAQVEGSLDQLAEGFKGPGQ